MTRSRPLDLIVFSPILAWLLMTLGSPVAAQTATYDYTVAKDGSGDYSSVQAAIDGAKSFPDGRITIFIKNGVYKEKVKVHSWNPRITFVGESADGTIITFDDHFDKIDRGRNSTFFTYTLFINANDFHARNLTVRNDAGPVGQAIALRVEGDRAVFKNCRFIGHQDTIFAAGEGSRQYFKDCYIEGTTDFIFGPATTVFEACRIHARKDSYITAASTPEGIPFGFVFLGCRLTAAPDVERVYLGRPWRRHARTVFIGCWMGGHVRPAGWHNWSKPAAERSTFYAEFNSKGPGANPARRADWAHTLAPEQAARYTLKRIFTAEPKPPADQRAWYQRSTQ